MEGKTLNGPVQKVPFLRRIDWNGFYSIFRLGIRTQIKLAERQIEAMIRKIYVYILLLLLLL